MEVPILTLVGLSGAERQGMPGCQLIDILKQSFFTRQIIEGEESVDHGRADFRLQICIGEECLDFRSEDYRGARLRVVERLDSDAVASQEQRFVPIIPNGEGKHSAQFFNAGFAQVFIEVNDCLRVALRSKTVAAAQQILTKLLIVVDFTVENNVDAAVLIR